MLMTPSLTSNYNPTFGGFGHEGVRHDLNRIYYGNEPYRADFLETQPYGPSGYVTMNYAPMSPASYAYGPAYGFPTGHSYSRAYEYPRSYTRGNDRMYEPRRGFEGPYTMVPTESGFATEPPVDCAETPDAYLVVVELPGVDLKDVTLQIHGGTLVLNGFRRPTWSNGTVTVNYHQAEGRFGALRRVLPLPSGVIPSQIQANFVNGLLSIILPKNAPGSNQVPQASIVINSAVPTNM